MTARPWNTASDEVQLATLRQALEQERGNIARAGRAIGISLRQAHRLVDKFELRAEAKQMRVRATGRATGRPLR